MVSVETASNCCSHTMGFLWNNETGGDNETVTQLAINVSELAVTEDNYGGEDPAECLRRRQYQVYRIIIDIFIVSFLCIAGLIGNTLAILVLKTDSMNSTVSFSLQALAVADNCYLLSCIFIQTLKAIYECTQWMPGLIHVFPKIEPIAWPLASMAQTTTVWITVFLTTDRYFAICKPFNKGRFCTPTRAKMVVALITCLAVIYNIPRFFEFQTIKFYDDCRNILLVVNFASKMRLNRIYFIVYKTCMFFLFRMLIPLGTLTVLNIRLIMSLRGARQSRAVLTNTSCPRNDSVTFILVSVVTVFIICQLPDFILRIVVTVRAFVSFGPQLHYVNTITNLLLTLNSSVNCLIYCLTGRRFRKVLKRLFFRTCSTSRPQFLVMDEQCPSENGWWRHSHRKRPVSATGSTDANVYSSILWETASW